MGKHPSLDIIMPGLFNLPGHELDHDRLAASTPALHHLLRYASQIPVTPTSFDRRFAELLGVEPGTLPFAKAMNEGDDGHQLLFKPIFLKPDLNNALVFPCQIDGADLGKIIRDLGEYFKADCNIKRATDDTWIMQLSTCDAPQGMPHYLTVVGTGVSHLMDQAKQNLPWFKLINEMQMFLHQHPINQQREQQGLTPVNSLWCWGGDPYDRNDTAKGSILFCDHPEFSALGWLYGAEVRSIDDLMDFTDRKPATVLDVSLLQALKGESSEGLEEVLLALEQRVFAPALQVARDRIDLYTSSSLRFSFHRRQRFKLWRRAVSIIDDSFYSIDADS
jgi:hypothetical protein